MTSPLSLRYPASENELEEVFQSFLISRRMYYDLAGIFSGKTMLKRRGLDEPSFYQIRVKGALGSKWADWFEGLTLTTDNDETILTGWILDQAALHGVLDKISDLGLPLLCVERI